jgi:alpha-glucosidase
MTQAERDADWWRGAVIYQIYPRSFCDSNGDGIGDLAGVTSRLDHIAGLGADAIWLCPFFTSPQRDFGYDVADHTAVDPIFGTLGDFDALVRRAHALGLRVLIDQVWSHTSDRHPWFLSSRADRTGPHADWYVWADPAPDGTPPNNWLSVFGGAAWRWEPRRRQYYLHHFLSEQPALNLHHPAVMDALLDSGAFWLNRGVDGFRLDAIDFLLHDAALRSNPAAPRPAEVPAKLFGLQRHDHDMMQPGTAGLLHRIRGLLDRFPGTVALGEISSQPGAFSRVMSHTAGSDRLHMAYTLAPLRAGFDRATLLTLLQTLSAAGQDGRIGWSFSNHDVERAISRWNPRRGEAPPPRGFGLLLLALQMSLRGSPILYQGEELGLTEATLAEADLRDPFGIAYWPAFRGRDGSRTPMPWQADAPYAGFSTATPWLPVPAEHHALAADVQAADPESLLHACRRLLAWRRTQPALQRGRLTVLDLPAPLVGLRRTLDGAPTVIAVFNFSPDLSVVDLVPWAGAAVQTASGFDPVMQDGRAYLPPYGVMFATVPAPVAAPASRSAASVAS